MAEENKNRTATVAIVTGIIALFLGLCLGVMFGGMSGYLVGRSSAPKACAGYPSDAHEHRTAAGDARPFAGNSHTRAAQHAPRRRADCRTESAWLGTRQPAASGRPDPGSGRRLSRGCRQPAPQ